MTDAEQTRNTSPLSSRVSLRSSRAPLGPRHGPRMRLSSTSLAPVTPQDNNRDSMASSVRSFTSASPGPSSPVSTEMSPRMDLTALPIIEEPIIPPPPPPSPLPPMKSPSPSPGRVPSIHAPAMNTIPEDTTAPDIEAPPLFALSRVASLPVSPAPTFKTVTRAATLPPPPKISFDPTPIAWKGLPLEAALWTFDSVELQTIVSRAIRSSAQESFIRLVSVDNLDRVLPAELQRLEAHKSVTQSKYRFNIHRRTMLLQALMSLGGSGGSREKDKDGGAGLVVSLATQLAEITSSCDSLAEELVRTTDQIRQITKLLDVHWASALAIALRKLNGSYGKRTTDLIGARDKISQLEAELEDAWKEAQRLAEEMDDIEAQHLDFDPDEETGVIGTAELIALPSPPATVTTIPVQLLPVRALPTPSRSLTPPPPISLTPPPPFSSRADSDNASVHSNKSNRILSDQSRVGMVSAARRRSLRTSMGSLRLPRRLNTRIPNINSPQSAHAQPPVPEIPKEFSPRSTHPPISKNRHSFLNLGDSPIPPVQELRKRTTLDDIEIVTREPVVMRYTGATEDDMYIMPLRDHELEASPKTFKKFARRSADNVTLLGEGVMGMPSQPQGAIPSIWMNADAPKTPAERVESMMETQVSTKGSSYSKLKSLKKRYSLPFAVLTHGSNKT